MTRNEHLLKCLEEEGCELAHRVSKAMRFGLNEVQPGQSLTNAERIEEEFLDVSGAYLFCVKEGLLKPVPPERIFRAIIAKEAKIEEFLAYAKTRGTLTEPPTLLELAKQLNAALRADEGRYTLDETREAVRAGLCSVCFGPSPCNCSRDE